MTYTLTGNYRGPIEGQAASTFQKVFWEMRSSDILGQVALLLAGVFGILALFRLKTKEKKHE